MTGPVQFVADTLCDAAGWQRQVAEKEALFVLENDCNLHIVSPCGERVFLYSPLLTLPDDEAKMHRLCEKIATYVLSTCKTMQSSVYTEHDKLVLFLRLQDIYEAERIVQEAKAFINEWHWWKEELSKKL